MSLPLGASLSGILRRYWVSTIQFQHRELDLRGHVPLELGIPHRQVDILQRLRRRTLQEVIDSNINNHSLAVRRYAKASDFDAVRARDIPDHWALTNNFDQWLACISVLIEVPDISWGEGLVEWDVDRMMNTLKPGGDMRDESDFFPKLCRDFLLVDVVDQ